MSILNINIRANLFDILSDTSSGVGCDCIVDANNTTRFGQLVLYSSKLTEKGLTPFIEVKFASKYGKRCKRLEVVVKQENLISIYKITTFSKFDKDALELSSVISEVKEKFNELLLYGVLLFFNKNIDINFVNNSLEKFTKNIRADFF